MILIIIVDSILLLILGIAVYFALYREKKKLVKLKRNMVETKLVGGWFYQSFIAPPTLSSVSPKHIRKGKK